jgi:hypothetical protein
METIVREAANTFTTRLGINLNEDNVDTDNKHSLDSNMLAGTLNNAKGNFFDDPVGMLLGLLFYVFVFIYFANDQIAQIVGFYGPIYHTRQAIHNSIITSENSATLVNLFKYMYLYGHLELFSGFTSCFGIHIYHFKIASIMFMLYLMNYHPVALANLYTKLCQYDDLVVEVAKNLYNRICEEVQKVRGNPNINTNATVVTIEVPRVVSMSNHHDLKLD